MERSSNFIKNIDNMKYTLKLVVRIVDLWFDETEDKVEQAEMLGYRVELVSMDEDWRFLIPSGGDKNVNIFSNPLDNVLGHTLAFKVRVQPKYKNSSVQKISDDPTVMRAILDFLSNEEEKRALGVLATLFHALRFWQKSNGVDLAPLLKKNLVYYRNNETEFVIYDFRPLVDLGGGVFFENIIGSRFIDQEVLHEISNLQDFQNIPKLFLFSTSCSGVTFNGIVEQPVPLLEGARDVDGEVGVDAAGGAEGAPAAGGGEGGSGRKWHGYGGDGVVVVVEEEEEEDSGMTMVMGWDCVDYYCEFMLICLIELIFFLKDKSGNLLYNKEKSKMKDCRNTSGEDVSFTSRITQSLTNLSQALRTASASNSRLCRSSHNKISKNSLELGPFSL
ncbi:hypothetical protein JHK85_001555 [Glycine max]|nr:hypothetical protein JHK85_001555 [Glycine max]